MPTGAIHREIDDQYKASARALVAQMTLDEKVLQMVHGAAESARLGIPAYNWWNEALHGVARAGVATVFPQAIGLAAMFDPVWLEKVADVISTEGRAKYEAASRRGDRDIYKGLTFWSPNINIFRDPRWGRGHETYGEDPFLTAECGKAFIRGIQGTDERWLKAAACAKHYAVHSGPEALRHHFDARSDLRDLWDTYLYAFEECVVDGQVESVMGAYNRTNGDPCCAHPYLLEQILRGLWQFDGHVTSDCWAIKDFHDGHGVTSNMPESAALAVRRGCDLNCGTAYLSLLAAVEDGLIDEAAIDVSLVRLMTARYRLGLLGDVQDQPWKTLSFDLVDGAEHRAINLETARRSLVLLKNNGVLPLRRESIRTLAVVGPNADNPVALLGNYNGTPNDPATPLRGFIETAAPGTRVLYAEGCHLYNPSMTNLSQPGDRISEALACADQADAVILCLGLDAGLEGEEGDTGNQYSSGDKQDLNLPGYQHQLLEALLDSGKPVIVVLLAGSSLAVPLADEKADAIIQAWYPGAQGGRALAQLVFGDFSPSGRLPVTFYRSSEELPDFTDYSMKDRTYRYMTKTPLYPFGFGLSYTSFSYGPLQVTRFDTEPLDADDDLMARRNDPLIAVSGQVTNQGSQAGREIIQLYLKAPADVRFRQAHHQLRGLAAIELAPGETKSFRLELLRKHFWQADDQGQRAIARGVWQIDVGGHQPDERSIELSGQKTQRVTIEWS